MFLARLAHFVLLFSLGVRKWRGNVNVVVVVGEDSMQFQFSYHLSKRGFQLTFLVRGVAGKQQTNVRVWVF